MPDIDQATCDHEWRVQGMEKASRGGLALVWVCVKCEALSYEASRTDQEPGRP
jgi:hypothetical protein